MVNRIRELLEARQLSPTQFADLIGVGRPVISHILSERNKPSLEVVQKVLDAFPDVSLTWLLKGSGPMLTATGTASVAPATAPVSSPPSPIAEAITAAPLPAPPAVPAPSPLVLAQPQVFTGNSFSPPNTARPAAAPAAYPLPPPFRPGPAKAAASLPQATAAAPLLPIETAAATIPVPEVLAIPAPLPAAAPIATAAGTLLAGLASYEPTGQPAPPAPTAFAQPAVSPAADSAAGASSTPAATEPAPANAAALSFLGEPGKAIRRIVIFYRDGSFSDYVPEGQ